MRLGFLGFVLKHSPLSMDQAQCEFVWNHAVLGALTKELLGAGASWFNEGCTALYKADNPLSAMFDREVALYLFRVKMADPVFLARPTTAMVHCVRVYFVFSNACAAKMVAQDLLKNFKVIDLDLVGFDTMWRLALTSTSNDVVTAVKKTLNALQQKLQEPATQLGPFRRDYVKRCMAFVHDDSADMAKSDRIVRATRLLAALLNEAEVQAADRVAAHRPTPRGYPMTVTVINNVRGLKGRGKKIKLRMYSMECGYHLVARAADALGYDRMSLRLFFMMTTDISKKTNYVSSSSSRWKCSPLLL